VGQPRERSDFEADQERMADHRKPPYLDGAQRA